MHDLLVVIVHKGKIPRIAKAESDGAGAARGEGTCRVMRAVTYLVGRTDHPLAGRGRNGDTFVTRQDIARSRRREASNIRNIPQGRALRGDSFRG